MVSCMRQRNMIIQRKIDFPHMHPGGSKKQCKWAIDQQSREIRVPVHVAENMKKVQKISKDLQQKFGREATPEEISDEMKDKSPEFVKEILSYLQNPVSLETPVGEDGRIILVTWLKIRMQRRRKML